MGAISLRVKQLGHEADQSPPSSAEVKNAWSYTSIHQYVFMGWCLVKHRDNFTFSKKDTTMKTLEPMVGRKATTP
jgi:hypothetical protein